MLEQKVSEIERALDALARAACREGFLWVTHYGAFDIQPRHLVYWICVKTDAERDRLAADTELMVSLRQVLSDHDYPLAGRKHVHIGFESEETVDRVAGGNWYHYWK